MGMFDTLHANGERRDDWQTKAYGCNLDRFTVGASMPEAWPGLDDYQVAILGAPNYTEDSRHSLATARNGVLVAVDVPRDEGLPLLDYFGHLVADLYQGSK